MEQPPLICHGCKQSIVWGELLLKCNSPSMHIWHEYCVDINDTLILLEFPNYCPEDIPCFNCSGGITRTYDYLSLSDVLKAYQMIESNKQQNNSIDWDGLTHECIMEFTDDQQTTNK